MKVTRTSRFHRDATRIALRMDEPSAGLRFLNAIETAAALLARQPLMGRARPEFGDGRRSWRVPGFGSWVIFYRVAGPRLRLQRVIHGARDLPRALGGD